MSGVRISPGKEEVQKDEDPNFNPNRNPTIGPEDYEPAIPEDQFQTLNTDNDKFEPVKSDPYENSQLSLLFKVKKTQIEMMIDRGYDVGDELAVLNMTTDEFVVYYRGIQENIRDERRGKGTTGKRQMTSIKTDIPVRSFKEALNNIYQNVDGKEMYVFYPESTENSTQTSKTELESILRQIEITPNLNVCIIIEHPPSNKAKDDFVNGLPSVTSQFFLYVELGYNPTKHSYVPRHELISDINEIKKVITDYQVQLTVLIDNTAKGRGRGRGRGADVPRSTQRQTRISRMPIISSYDPIAKYLGAKQGDVIKVYRENISFDSMVSSYVIYRYVWNVLFETKKR